MKERIEYEPFVWTADALREASLHVKYEIEMLFGSLVYVPQTVPTVLHNLIVEGFAMHARVLMEFIHSRKPADHPDIAAWRYIGSSTRWGRLCPVSYADLNQYRTRVNREIVHLSADRLWLTPAQKAWRRTDLMDPLLRALGVWMDHADRELLNPEFCEWWDVLPELYPFVKRE